MPLIELNDSAPEPVKSTPVRMEPTNYKGVTVDSKYVPASKLLTYLEGSSWTVNYFRQVLDTDNATTGQNLGASAIHQQYILIERLELRVISALTQSQDATTKAFTITGSANLYPSVIPNEGDMFLADVGDGREAIFTVINSEQKSIFKDTAYTIEYQLVDYSTVERIADLNKKVQHSYVFVKDFYAYGKNPLVEKKEFFDVRKLQQLYKEMVKIYFKTFFSKTYSTLVLPGQEAPTYDPFLIKAVLSFFSVMDADEIKFVRELNVNDDENMSTTTLWDVIASLEYSQMNYIATQMGTVSPRVFNKNPMLEGIYFSRLGHVVYPIDPVLSADNSQTNTSKPIGIYKLKNVPGRTNLPPTTPLPLPGCEFTFFEDLVKDYIEARDKTAGGGIVDVYEYDNNLKNRYYEVMNSVNDSSPNPGYDFYEDLKRGYLSARDLSIGGPYEKEFDPNSYTDILETIEDTKAIIPDIHLVTKDDYYIFSEGFYKFNNGLQGPGMSRLEIMVCRMLRQMSVDNMELLRLCESYHYWGALERFYYAPILMVLINYSTHS